MRRHASLSQPRWCSGNPVSVEVQSVTDGVKVKVSRVPDGVAEYSVWGLKLPTLRHRLFRCVSIRENDDGTYAITAVQHVPEKSDDDIMLTEGQPILRNEPSLNVLSWTLLSLRRGLILFFTAALLLNVLSRRFLECSRALSSVICTTSMSEGSQTMV